MRSKKLTSRTEHLGEAHPQLVESGQDRRERLERLRLAIDSGTYRISGEKIADKIISKLVDRAADDGSAE